MTQIKNILLCVDSSHYAESAASSAEWIANRLQAHVHILSVSDIRQLQAPWISDLAGVAGVQPYESFVPQLQKINETQARVITDAIASRLQKSGITCNTTVKTGSVVHTILDSERTAEVIIMGQRGEHHENSGEWLGSTIERVIRKSIKPCLITPEKFHPISHILVAYDGSNHANHALYTAIDWSLALKTRLTILTVETDTDKKEKSPVLIEGMELARRQGVEAHGLTLQGNPEESILAAATDQKADLIVMGAYGHNRLRELILGSATNHVIRKSKLPVLLCR